MKLNGVWFDENQLLIFRVKEFNDKTRKLLDEHAPLCSNYYYNIQEKEFYRSNQKDIDGDIESLGHSLFPLVSYWVNKKSRHATIIKMLNEKTLEV